LSVCPSAWIRANLTEQIFMSFHIWEFYKNLSTLSNFGYKWKKVTGALH
jgi:hypothetical protein